MIADLRLGTADQRHVVLRLLSVLTAGVICGLLAVMFSISAAALLFSGDLSKYITVGIGVCLIGTIFLNCGISVLSSHPGMVSVVQEVTVVTLSVIAMSIYTAMSGVQSDDEIIATIVVMIGLATALAGLCLLAMGVFRLGRLIRFIPYPVMGGFLAGMGWLILTGALGVILGQTLTLENAHVLLSPYNIAKWLPALIFAVAIGVVTRRTGSPFVLPIAVIVAFGVFYLSVWGLDLSLVQLRSEGWMFLPLSQHGIWLPWDSNLLVGVHWGAIWPEAPKVSALVAITATSVLFASSGIELSVRRDLDLDRELRAAGIANLLAGAGSGAAGFQGLGLTLLSHQLGAPYRMVGIIVAIVCASMLLFGGALLAYMPIPIFGGLLLWIGILLLYEWMIEAYARMPRREYLIIVLMVAVIASVGPLVGVSVGLFFAVVMFALEYSRVEIVKYAVTGEDFESSIEHNADDRHFLTRKGRQLLVLRLQGFVFFGTVHKLQQLVTARLRNNNEPELRFLLLDCQDVTGLDSSAARGFMKIGQLVQRANGAVVVANLRASVRDQLAATRTPSSGSALRVFDDLDRSVEWCEEQLLQSWADRPKPSETACIGDQLERIFGEVESSRVMLRYLDKIDLQSDAVLIQQGETSRDIFFIESGRVSVLLETPESAPVRVRTLLAGTMVGEISFCLGQQRSASVVTETGTTVWRLNYMALERMTAEAPEIAASFNSYLVRTLAERLTQTTRLVRLLTN